MKVSVWGLDGVCFFFVAGKSTSPMYLVKKFKFTFVGFTRSYKCLAEFQPGVVWMAVTIATACTVLYIVLGISNLLRLFLFKHCKISQFLHHHTPIYLCCRRHNLNIWLLSLGFLPFLWGRRGEEVYDLGFNCGSRADAYIVTTCTLIPTVLML